jgi:hypothetical protein
MAKVLMILLFCVACVFLFREELLVPIEAASDKLSNANSQYDLFEELLSLNCRWLVFEKKK